MRARRTRRRKPLSTARAPSMPRCGRSEAVPHGEVQAPGALARAIGKVGTDRSDRRAKANAAAVAGGDIGANSRVPDVAGVEEGRNAPVLAEPVGELDAADDQPPAADHGAGLLDADALERIAAHRLVAAGAEEEGARDALARRRAHGAGLPAKEQVVGPAERQEDRCAGHSAQE